MNIDLGTSTNKGTALLKFAHQFQPDRILHDEFVSWFFGESIAHALQANALKLGIEPTNEAQEFLHIAYWYTILREIYGDRVITEAIASGCQQLLLLGAGYDTRFFRLPQIREEFVATFEVDLLKTIEDKQEVLINKLGQLPEGLTLIPLDFNQDDLNTLADYGFNRTLATAYVWQGVSYYLPQASVSLVLDFMRSQMTSDSVLIFDACSPLMTYKNDQIPGIAASIDHLNRIGEPFLFGMNSDEMQAWLQNKGFRAIEILQQNDLEAMILRRRTLPNNMWYVVAARV
jgi:methyltransferase (TIGR00027 family)